MQTQCALFEDNAHAIRSIIPRGYHGLAGFHKYWGKKPAEHIRFSLNTLTQKGDVVFDPFLGSALTAFEISRMQQCFIECDVNPLAIELGNMFLSLPSSKNYADELKLM